MFFVCSVVMILMTIGEGLVTKLVTSGDYLVMTHNGGTNNHCENTDNHDDAENPFMIAQSLLVSLLMTSANDNNDLYDKDNQRP